MFIDEAIIRVKAGDGGNGCMAFRREKFVPRGGPSGGDGGRGGDVVLRSSEGCNTLLHFKYNPEHKADRGRHGEGSNKTGKSAPALVLHVPPGSIVFDADTGEQLFDFTEPDQEFIAARGGHGGRGNARFATSTNQAPRHHEPGELGEERTLRVELKLLADVGLVGFPNAGKSTFISRVSAAHPKIADYPFTTLEPNLGVVDMGEYETFVIADIPGLIEGAHEGHGLGHQFLRHIERTSVLLHLVDVSEFSGRDPVEDYEIILRELESFSDELTAKPMIVAGTKIDACQDESRREELRERAKKDGRPYFEISAVTGEGVKPLLRALGERVKEARAEAEAEAETEADEES
ncbi:MAG: GTPase ObgE [Bryobacterales bacterium]